VATGVHDGAGAAKQLLAGAVAVQLCSTLMQHGVERIGVVLGELRAWMERHGFSTIDDFRGKLSRQRSGDHPQYERLQYLKVYGGLT
jgi:dihydroorotate dehydrogenase (fumarate)